MGLVRFRMPLSSLQMHSCFATLANLHSHNGRIGDVVEDALEVAGSPLVANSQVDVAGRVQLTGCVVILKEDNISKD